MDMVAAERSDLIDGVHRSPSMAVLVVTGGGSRAVADLLTVPGASRTVLEAWAPYGERSLTGFLGATPRQAVSVETASAMARKACERAVRLRPRADAPVMGVACTAALATDRPRKGDHRAHVAVCADGTVTVRSVTLEKGARSREAEERAVADLVLSALGRACGVESRTCDALLPREEVRVQVI